MDKGVINYYLQGQSFNKSYYLIVVDIDGFECYVYLPKSYVYVYMA